VIAESYEREVRDLPCFEYLTTVVIELHRLRCPVSWSRKIGHWDKWKGCSSTAM
jgi:hypothetical protein